MFFRGNGMIGFQPFGNLELRLHDVFLLLYMSVSTDGHFWRRMRDMEEEARQNQAMKLIRLLACTLIISVMSAGMFNIVLPQIREQFHLTLSQVSWMTSVYTLIYAIGTVIYGKLADRYRLKQLLTAGLLVFAAGSVLGLCSATFGMVIFGRALQAAGAAVIPATATLIPVRYFPVEKGERPWACRR